MPPHASGSPPAAGDALPQQLAGPARAVEVEPRPGRLELEQRSSSRASARGVEPLRVEHAHGAQPREPARAPPLLVLLGRRVRHDERGDAARATSSSAVL